MKQGIASLAVFVLLAVTSAAPVETDIVTEILRVIDGQENLFRVAEYLNASRADLIQDLPIVDTDGKRLSYTFFAPTSTAFLLQLPQDVADPLFLDAKYRRTVLLRHFSRQRVSTLADLAKLDQIVMADSRAVNLTRNLENVQTIDDEEILADQVFELANDLGTVFVMTRAFVYGDEISDILSSHPNQVGFGFFLGVPSENGSGNIDETLSTGTNEKETELVSDLDIRNTPLAPPVLGGYNNASTTDDDVKEMIQFATTSLSQIYQTSNALSPLELVSVIKAEKQVVGGLNYKLNLEFKGTKPSYICDVVVFDQPWTSTRRINSFNCNPSLTAV